MKRGRYVLLILLACWVVVVAAVAVLVWPRAKEPEYKGRALSRWIAEYTAKEPDESSPEYRAAAEAVRQVGTNGIPCLLRWLAHEDPDWGGRAKVLAGEVVSTVSQELADSLRARPGSVPSRQAWGALFGFKILGRGARSAMPELAKLVNGPRGQVSVNAMIALSELGGDGLPVLLTVVTNTANPLVVTNPVSPIRMAAVAIIGGMGTNANPAVSVLVRCLQDRDGRVAVAAAMMLGRLHTDPELVVPALVGGLQNGNVRRAAVVALGEFGQLARPAVPALVRALDDSDHSMRTEATNALRKIAPEVLEEGIHVGKPVISNQ